jgi:hypothetical protein
MLKSLIGKSLIWRGLLVDLIGIDLRIGIPFLLGYRPRVNIKRRPTVRVAQ